MSDPFVQKLLYRGKVRTFYEVVDMLIADETPWASIEKLIYEAAKRNAKKFTDKDQIPIYAIMPEQQDAKRFIVELKKYGMKFDGFWVDDPEVDQCYSITIDRHTGMPKYSASLKSALEDREKYWAERNAVT